MTICCFSYIRIYASYLKPFSPSLPLASFRDDPRFPTVRGVLRRGMTVEGLKQFIAAQVNPSAKAWVVLSSFG